MSDLSPDDIEAEPVPDPRIEAMAREWCRMMNADPDRIVRGLHGKEQRWKGYAHNMHRLMVAADAADPMRL